MSFWEWSLEHREFDQHGCATTRKACCPKIKLGGTSVWWETSYLCNLISVSWSFRVPKRIGSFPVNSLFFGMRDLRGCLRSRAVRGFPRKGRAPEGVAKAIFPVFFAATRELAAEQGWRWTGYTASECDKGPGPVQKEPLNPARSGRKQR